MGQQRRGSWFSDRQIANAVRRNRQVEFIFIESRVSVKGYVAGWDDYHWFVVNETQQVLIHKNTVYVNLAGRDGEAKLSPEVECIVAPFRERIMIDYFGASEVPTEGAAT